MTQASGDLSWYALRTSPKLDFVVRKHLIRRGYKAFTKIESKFGAFRNGQRKEREAPAAPGYVFLGTTGNPWTEVHHCTMIHSVVSVEGKPARLHPEELGKFLNFRDDSMPDYFRFFREAPFAIGDMVKIDSKSFEGFELRVKDIQRGEAIFSLVMMGRETEARFPVSQCFKAA
jgi:transcription antitermination factor NusG